MNKILVIAAHPDDEVLGCGATIAKHAQRGDEVHILIMAEGITSRTALEANLVHENLSMLAKAAHRAGAILGVKSVTLKQFPDNRMDSLDRLDVIREVELEIKSRKPNIIYTHHAGDVNIDHRRVHEAVITAVRPIPGCSVDQILTFEVASSTEWQPPLSNMPFLPNWFEDVTETIELKLKALDAYEMEMRSWPHVRSIESLLALSKWRGATIGAHAAEAFMLARKIGR